MRCSWAKASKRVMASRKVPAERTCSHVRVVRLAVGDRQPLNQQTDTSGGEGGVYTVDGVKQGSEARESMD